jgi:hypothetical protein
VGSTTVTGAAPGGWSGGLDHAPPQVRWRPLHSVHPTGLQFQNYLDSGLNKTGQRLCLEDNQFIINNKTETTPTWGGWQGPLTQ